MFYIWHTLLIATFIAVAYYLGFTYGKRQNKVKKTFIKVRLVPEDSKMKDHGYYYYAKKPTKGEKARTLKLRVRKYDPITRKHIWWVEKKLPPHSK